ncbi:MAG: pyridoxamine 5'-phosphate oxidase [Gammaproteobacteria bacterium]|nr:pyridoxamine 5'-phosphate oxidase [Gammaproteobacteria bacterium]
MSIETDLLPDPPPAEPLVVAERWLQEARGRCDQPNPDAMALATASRDARPSVRMVLCKEIVADPGYVVFFSNYESRKGSELEMNPHAAATLHWDHLQRQVRIEGIVTRVPEAESDAYFATRPWQRRIGAWASAQSRPIASRAALVATIADTAGRFGAPMPGPVDLPDPGLAIPRPPHWGGYRLWAERVELWVEGFARIHDRVSYCRTLTAAASGSLLPGPWTSARLQP